MKGLRRLLIPAMACCSWLFSLSIAASQSIPDHNRSVIDLTHTLTAKQTQQIEQQLQTIHKKGMADIAVLIVPSTQPESIFTYALRVSDQWKLGTQQKDNGLLLVVALQDRTTQILAGYELDAKLPDPEVNHILQDIVPPHFRRSAYAEGLQAAITALQQLLQNKSAVKSPHPHP